MRKAGQRIEDADSVASIINPRLNGIIQTLWEELEDADVNFRSSAEEAAESYRTALDAVVAESRADLRVARQCKAQSSNRVGGVWLAKSSSLALTPRRTCHTSASLPP
jgi:hypothetical protein